MPKIPTFQAEGSIEQLAGTTSNIKINPNSNIFSALKPVTDAVVNFKIKENDAQNKTEALKLENDFITDMQKVYDEVNVLENKEIANQILKTKSNALIEKHKATATNGSVQSLFNNYALSEVQKGIFRTNTQISKNILTSLDNNVALKEKRLLTTAFLAEGNFDYGVLKNDLTNLYTTNYKGKIPNANLKKLIDSIPGRIEGFEATKMIIDNPKLAWLKLNDDKQFPNLNLDTRIDLIQDAKGVLLPMVQNDWSNFLLAASLGKEIDFDMEFAKEIIEPKVFNKMLQQYDSLKNSVANVAIIYSISNADISETIEGFNETIDNEVETGVKTFKEGNDEKNIYLKAVVARNTAMDSNPILFITQTSEKIKKLVEELETIDAVKNNELYLQKKLALVNELVKTQIDMGQPPYKIKVMSISEADGFVERYNNGDAETRVAMLANLEAEFGEYNSQAMLQLSNAGLPIAAQLSSFFGNPAITNRFMNYDEKEEIAKLEKFAKDNDIDFKEIQENISAEIQEFEDIIARNNNINTSKAIAKLHNIKKVLAYDVLNSMWVDKNQDQGAAEEKAASLIKDHFVIEKTFYVPTIYNGEDISHTIESDTGIIAKADFIQKYLLDEFNAVAFESENKDVTEVQLTEEMKEQMEDNGEWRNTADGNGLIFGIVFPDGSFAPVKNADGEFLTFNFDDTSLTIAGMQIEYSKKIESDYYSSYKAGNYASRNIADIIAMKAAMEAEKTGMSTTNSIDIWNKFYKTETKIVNGKEVKMTDREIRFQKNKATKRLNNGNYDIPPEAKSSIDIATNILEGQNKLSKKQLTKLLSDIGQIESEYDEKIQIGGGPARSYWQIEPATALDTLKQNLIAANEGRDPLFGSLFEKQFAGIIKGKSNTTVLKYLSSLSNSKMQKLLLDNSDLAATIALGIVLNRQ